MHYTLLVSKVIRVQSEQGNQGYKEMKGHTLQLQITYIKPKKEWSGKTAKTTLLYAYHFV